MLGRQGFDPDVPGLDLSVCPKVEIREMSMTGSVGNLQRGSGVIFM